MLDFLNRLYALMGPVWAAGLTGAWAAAIVLLLRLVLKNRVPRQVLCLLWLVVFARLALPFSLQSPVSLVPDRVAEDIPARVEQFTGRIDPLPEGDQTVLTPDQLVNPSQTGPQTQTGVTAPTVPSAPRQFPLRAVTAGVWLAGLAAMLGYALFSYLRLKRKLAYAIRTKYGAWEHPAVGSPFILGMLCPRIYVPVGVADDARRFILCHERAHLDRGDHIVKPLCWLILAVHWYNPAAWAAFLLLSRDMEAACDERVLRVLGEGVKADYSSTLLSLATGGRFPAPSPLAFAEGDAKFRVKNVLRYHRPAVTAVLVGVVAVVIAAVCLLTSPMRADRSEQDVTSEEGAKDVTFEAGSNGDSSVLIRGLDAGWLEYSAGGSLYIASPRFLGAPFDSAGIEGRAYIENGVVTADLNWNDPRADDGTVTGTNTVFSVDLASEALTAHEITYDTEPGYPVELTDGQMIHAGLELGGLIRQAQAFLAADAPTALDAPSPDPETRPKEYLLDLLDRGFANGGWEGWYFFVFPGSGPLIVPVEAEPMEALFASLDWTYQGTTNESGILSNYHLLWEGGDHHVTLNFSEEDALLAVTVHDRYKPSTSLLFRAEGADDLSASILALCPDPWLDFGRVTVPFGEDAEATARRFLREALTLYQREGNATEFEAEAGNIRELKGADILDINILFEASVALKPADPDREYWHGKLDGDGWYRLTFTVYLDADPDPDGGGRYGIGYLEPLP